MSLEKKYIEKKKKFFLYEIRKKHLVGTLFINKMAYWINMNNLP